MRSAFFACVAVAIVATTLAATGGAAAQANAPNGSGIETNSSINLEPETYVQEVDSETRIVEWSYVEDRDGFEIVFEANSSKRITITEAVQFSEGSGSGRIYQERIPEGQTRIFVSVPRRAGQAAVTMTTPRSIAENRYTFISTGQADPNRPPITFQRAQLLVILAGFGGVGLTYGMIKKRREDEEKAIEKIL